MKKSIAKISLAVVLTLMMLMASFSSVFAASNGLLDTTKKVSFTMTCDKQGYTFNVYKVASLDRKTTNPYEVKYTSLVPTVTSADVTKKIVDGDSVGLLAALDQIGKNSLPTVVDTFGPTGAGITTKTLTNLDQGVYYVKAVNYPAGVKEVRNSVFALPYFPNNDEGWTYEIDAIPLATKVVDEDITTEKTITNSTKGSTNFTDVSIGDTIDFEIRSTVTGDKSHTIITPEGDEYLVEDFKLNSYYVTDDMSKGLKLDKNSFKVRLLNEAGDEIATLSSTGDSTGGSPDYTVTYETGFDGTDVTKNTKFTVALTKAYLQKNNFYEDDVYYTSITYSAVLNDEAVVGPKGNPNTENEIVYSNKNDVTVKHKGNTVYVYTYAVTADKKDPDGNALAGATFELYKTEADATNSTNPIARGVSDSNGKVVFLALNTMKPYSNYAGKEISLQSGTYYVKETIAPDGFNLYGKVITVDLTATYNDTLTDGTYVATCAADGNNKGTAHFSVVDSKLIVPKTGGYGDMMLYVGGAFVGVLGFGIILAVALKSRKRKESQN